MNIDLDLLAIQNPWWQVKKIGSHFSGLKFDPVIYFYSQQKIKWQPPLVSVLKLKPGQIYLLQGPQGTGKTTAQKLIIKELIEEKKVKPEDVFYYSCFNLDTFEQLNEVIKTYLHWRDNEDVHYIFIDKITILKNWHQGIRHIQQAGRLKNSSLVLSGYTMSGQINSGKDEIIRLNVFPLDFSQVLDLLNPELTAKINPDNFQHYHKRLEYYLDIYLLTGGYVSAVNSYLEHGAVSQQIYQNQLNWLIADIAKLGRDPILTRQVLERLVLNLGRPLGYQTIAKKTKAKTHLTVAEYLDILESLYVVKAVYQQATGEPSRKAKKFYFYDPFLFWLYYGFVHGALDYWQFARERLHQDDLLSGVVDNAVFSHLAKCQAEERSGAQIYYWRDSVKKHELTFVWQDGRRAIPIAVCPDQPAEERAEKIILDQGFKQGIIISQRRLEDKHGIKIMPLTYFLLFYRRFFHVK